VNPIPLIPIDAGNFYNIERVAHCRRREGNELDQGIIVATDRRTFGKLSEIFTASTGPAPNSA
jgi:hypothetical protein